MGSMVFAVEPVLNCNAFRLPDCRRGGDYLFLGVGQRRFYKHLSLYVRNDAEFLCAEIHSGIFYIFFWCTGRFFLRFSASGKPVFTGGKNGFEIYADDRQGFCDGN